MAGRTNYITDQIDREDLARRNYENSPSDPARKAKLGEEYDRTVRAINQKDVGPGRSSGRGGRDAGELGKKYSDTFK